jgi:hypothetical protein
VLDARARKASLILHVERLRQRPFRRARVDQMSEVLKFLQRGSARANAAYTPSPAILFTASVIGVSLLLAMAICFVYQRTHKGLQYSRSARRPKRTR